jgi:hypothetical protein
MTTGTLAAKLTSVQIVIAVTGNTARGWFGLIVFTRLVTGLAGSIRVRTVQDKTGAGVVVEFPQEPIIRVVTGATVCAQTPLVWIIPCVAIGALPRGTGKLRREVTRLTSCHCMQPNQGKICQVMIESNIGFPGRFLVTTSTVLTQSPLMNVIILVAGKARRVERHVGQASCVAGLAVQGSMCTPESKIGVRLVIEPGGRPLLSIVASLAVGAVATLVNIIQQVTGHAFLIQRLENLVALVTAAARHFSMSAMQSETAFPAMVECCRFPLFCLVALRAFLAIFSPVVIVDLMAGIAIRRDSFITLVGVAHGTLNLCMRPSQGEIRIACVVE